jgi:glutamate synthase domain-containing protein 3
MHGGAIYLRGGVDPEQLGREVGVTEPDDGDLVFLADAVGSYAAHFQVDPERILKDQFVKLYPKYLRPYGRLYAS